MKRLFIEIHYDPELGEVGEVIYSLTEWSGLHSLDRCDVYDAVGNSLAEAILKEYQQLEVRKKPKLWKVGNGCLVLSIFFKTKINI